MHKTTWPRLDPPMRLELEALVADPNDAFLSDYKDALGWWLLVLLSCLLGGGMAIWSLVDEPMGLGTYLEIAMNNPGILANFPSLPGLAAALLVGTWTLVTAWRNRGRRGFAALSKALIVVRGPKLKVLRYDAIESTEAQVIGQRGKRFTVLSLKLKDGTSESLNVHGTWASIVMAKVEGVDPTPR